MVNHDSREMTIPATSSRMGRTQSPCRKVRVSSAGESRGGANQSGIRLEMPNCLAAADCRRYWFQSRPSKAPVSAAISPAAGTFETMIVALREYDADNSYAVAKYIRLDSNGRQTFESAWQVRAISSTTALVPWVFVQERGGVDRNVRIDFIDVRARRTEN